MPLLLGGFVFAAAWLVWHLYTVGGLWLPLVGAGVFAVWFGFIWWDSRSFEDQKAAFRSYKGVWVHGHAWRRGDRLRRLRQRGGRR